ncbi:Hypothetical predicted protein [Mytilus galloprovincialis]|uniref:YqaJ viral recombinase domain-containing protein n=1 Tax=Mytilus galloprovincialis TaxID=29158 RepID=A0A8B6F4P5_MYTGA|nr:Hypothetical predicted protein [Mytilus galloprovincialis]
MISMKEDTTHAITSANAKIGIKNICLNHTTIGSFPISHLFQPANPYAIVDHDYFKLSPEDHWLKDNTLFQISDEDITSIQAFTVNQFKSKQWLYERCKRLTSSNFGRICKATHRTDFHKLALSYTRSSALYTAAIKHGRQYEPVAIEKYESITKLETVKCGLFVSKMHPFLAASPDGLTENKTLLEIKCPYTARNKLITPKSVPYLSEVNGELILDQKHDYYYQIQGQLFCTGKQTCDFFVYTHEDHKLITIQRNDRFIVEMKDALTSFYEKYFKRVLDKFMYNSYDKYSW